MARSIGSFVLKGFLWLVYVLILLGCCGTIYFHTGLGYLGAGGFFVLMILLAWFRSHIGGAYFLMSGICLLVIAWFFSIEASGEGPWQKPWGRMPEVERLSGSKMKIHNIRDFAYNKSPDDYTVRYVDEEYDLNGLKTLDFAISHWDGLQHIAHTMLSFGFDDGRYLAISMETRLPEGHTQNSVAACFKQYNLICLMAKEEDLFALRSNLRKEEMFLYRLKIKPEDVRRIFMYFTQRVNVLNRFPEFYNTVTANCTTELQPPFRECFDAAFDNHWSPLLNGMSDQRGFDKGVLEHQEGETFDELKKRAKVPEDILPNRDYSRIIREKTGIR